MHICLNMDPTTVDSRKNADPCTSTFHFLIYEGLTRIRPNGEGELALAESVDVSSDGKVYLFHLREAYWSDGTPITARDFEHSWKKILTPDFGSPCPYLLYPIQNAEKASQGLVSPDVVGVQALDAKTLRITLENPTPYFLSLITFCNFYPIPSHIELKNPSWELSLEDQLVVSGPYRLVRWEKSKEVFLQKNPTYWDAKNVRIEEILMSIIPHDRTALQMFEQGELDFVGTMTSPLGLEDLAYCRKNEILQIKPLGGIAFCTFNLDRFPFQNKNIRKALSLAIDRNAIAQNILQLSETPATRIIPPVLVNHQNRQLFPAHDAEMAREFLKKGMEELGTDKHQISKALVLSYENNDVYHQIAQIIQHQWKAILGLDATLLECDRKVLMTKHMEKNYAIGIDRFFAQYNDPNNILERFKYKNAVKNLPGFEHPEYIRLLTKASELNDPLERLQVLERAEELLAEEMPITPIIHFNQGVLIHPKYDHVEFSPLGNLLFKDLIVKE